MDDRSLYATILGMQAPWDVERVELRETEQAVHVWMREQSGTRFGCPECAATSPIHDHVERMWRHLDTCQFQTLLHAAVPRVHCATHGVRTIQVPWAERLAHFTLLFERLAIAWLQEATPTAVSAALASPGKRRTLSWSAPCAVGCSAGPRWPGAGLGSTSIPFSSTTSS